MAARRVRAAGALVVMLAAGLFGPSAAQAVSGGNPVAEGRYGFAVKVESTARSCSGALVDPQWVLTAASCFPENIANGQTAPSGAPKVAFTAIVGRTNLSTSAGHQVAVVDLVGRSDRNVVLAKLATRVTDIAPVPIATAPPATGEVVRVAGYGRTATEWVPGLLHTGQFTVDAVHPAGLDVTGQGTAAICKGDAGGPAFRETDNRVELVAINDRSWQGGCYREDETRRGATQSRLDDLTGWVTETTRFRGVAAFYDYGGARTGLWLFDDVAGPGSATPRKPWESGTGQWDFARTKPMSGDFTGDGRLDIAALYDNGGDTTALWLFENVGAPTPPEPRKVWQSGAGNWTFDRTTPLAGDFDGNGTADIAAMYHYGNGHVRVFLFDHVATPSEPHNRITWDSGPGAWDPARAKPVTGDFDNDGRTDIAALYNYDNATTGLWLFDRVAAGGTPFNRQVWGSGAGNWAFDRTTPVPGPGA
ncbi:trypsin-like serine protease [Jidongwangia harbinensis]|uniref:trypsin-like serine protease n=1 Tax=Jidongwangia harbinensis TaxID=2878561 RepID=UPI001CDA062D|nr:trypsin-like serine protease [Jidongwangia harbinensis]MCA2211737.1 trypsin-like serine protease [Jidongwangia harbinensis]